MKQRTLGSTFPLTVSAIGMGCMGFSHGYGSGPDNNAAIALMRQAHELGCTFYDTAEGYADGANEILVGKALKPFRHKIVLATKFHIEPPAAGHTLLEDIKAHLAASLDRLQTDTIDLYYLHRINPAVPLEDIAEAMGVLIREGHIRSWGISQATEAQVRLCHSITPLTAVQNEYSIMERMFEKDVLPACEELGIGFVPFSPLGAGFLSGKYTPQDEYHGDDVRRVITRFHKDNMAANQPLLDWLHAIADAKDATPAQIALAWLLKKSTCVVPIPGMRKPERIVENLGAAAVVLSDEELAAMDAQLADITIYGNRTDEDIMTLKDLL